MAAGGTSPRVGICIPTSPGRSESFLIANDYLPLQRGSRHPANPTTGSRPGLLSARLFGAEDLQI
jgi:hypothetical protein